jgi:hypothetical protein
MSTLNETSIKATADAMVDLGLVDLGYNYRTYACCLSARACLPEACPACLPLSAVLLGSLHACHSQSIWTTAGRRDATRMGS